MAPRTVTRADFAAAARAALGGTYYPADLAIVEDFPGEDLYALLLRDPDAAAPAMGHIAEHNLTEALALIRD
jgi:hypothetical protein